MVPIQIFYYVLPILGGHIGIPISLATIFFAKNQSKRHPTFISFLVSWIVFSSTDLVLLYSGQEIKSPTNPPPHSLCLFQACFIYARFVLVTLNLITLLFSLWLEITARRLSPRILASIVWIPWISFVIMVVASAVYGSLNPSEIATEGIFYCNFATNNVAYVATCIALACILGSMYFEVLILRIMWNSSRQFRREKSPVCHLSVRMVAFTAYSFLNLIISVLVTFSPKVMGLYVFLASLPFAAFLILGTQRENLSVWFGSCFPALNNPYANTLAGAAGRPPKRSATDELHLTRGATRVDTIDASFKNPGVSLLLLDKRLPKTPTGTDDVEHQRSL